MSEIFEEFPQYCFQRKKNIIIEEHFEKNGAHFFVCRQKDKCSHKNCQAIKRLTQQMNSMKTFEK